MNLTNIVQEYKKLLTLEDYYNYKFDPRMKFKGKRRSGFSTRPVPEYNESDIELLHLSANNKYKGGDGNSSSNNGVLLNSDTFSKSKHVINTNTNVNNDNDNVLMNVDALHLYTKDNGHYHHRSQTKLSYAISSKYSNTNVASHSHAHAQQGNIDNEIIPTRCKHKRLCKAKCREISTNTNTNTNTNDANNREKLVKKVRYSVNNFPCVTLGTYGQISSVEGIKTYCDTTFINKKMREELDEYNESITPLFKIKKYSQYDDSVKYVERFKVRDVHREFKNANECYVVTKPYFPVLRGKFNMNNVVKRKYKGPRVLRKKGWLQVVQE